MTRVPGRIRHNAASVNQSEGLSRAIERDSSGKISQVSKAEAKIIAVTSGKGGVGKTNVVANLAVGLSELGKKAVILDADFGLANMDVLLGLTPRFHLGHVLFGNKSMQEIMIQGPSGIRIIPASSGLRRMSELTSAQRMHLVESLASLAPESDYLLIDTAAGISRNVIYFLTIAQEVIVVSAPEPTAIVDAYAMIKIILAEDSQKNVQVLINSAEDAAEGQEVFCQINSVVKRFIKREVSYLGHIQRDAHVALSVRSQMLVTQRFPDAPASLCFRELAHNIAGQKRIWPQTNGLDWERLVNNWIH